MAEGESPNGPDTGGPQPSGTEEGSDEGLIQTFLIADIRGYSRFTQDHGDEAAGRLAARYAEVTTEVIKARGGTVIELTGDEALCVFSTTRRAIRAAIDLQARFLAETESDPALPLPVGIGIDTGEAVPVGAGFRGRALNLASRLCATARAGEILATREAVHMAGRMDGIHVEDRGLSSFKNIAEPVSVMRVTKEGEDPARWFAERYPAYQAPKPRASSGRRLAIAGLATVLVAGIAIPLIATRGSASTSIDPNSIGILDPESGDVVETVELPARPGSVAASANSVWVTHPDIGRVTQIDPNDQEIRDSIQVGENPTGIAVGEDAVWVVNSGGPSVSRISLATNDVVKTIEVGNGPVGVAVGEGSVWVTNRFDGTISRINPDSNAVIDIPVGLDPRGIAVGFGSVWVGLAGSNSVVRVDPLTNELTQSIGVGNAPGSLAVSADEVWVVNTLDDTVMRISPDSNSIVDTTEVGDGPSGIEILEGIVWVANEGDGTLSRIESSETSVLTMVIESSPQGLVGANGNLWVSVRGTATSHRGGTLRLVSLEPPSSLDPGRAYDPRSWSVLHLFGDGLVAFEPVGGTNPTLVPDLATSIPTPTEAGRTYAFDLRSGIRYSNGEVVAPNDFRRAIERGFRLNRIAVMSLYSGLLGGAACAEDPPTCDLSRGIETDDASGTITFHLVDPDPEFLYKLTLPFAYPVPASTPDEHQKRAGVPGTGPYMLEAPRTSDGLALVRNPHFRVWSSSAQPDAYADRIEWAFGVEPKAEVEAVAIGEADVGLDASASDRLEEIYVRFAAQVHTAPSAATYYVVLDTTEPPFDDVDVRKAMNLALDRNRVVEIFGEGTALPTCQQLPPNFPGYEPYCPYTSDPGEEGSGTWSGPDIERANELVRRSGTVGMRVVFKYPPFFWDPQGAILADYLMELLDELGYRGSVRALSTADFYSPDNEVQMALDAWAADYPAASNLIAHSFNCDASFPPLSGFCDPRVDAMIDRAIRIQADDPAASGALWAEIDHAVVDQAPYLWLVNPITVDFVSERVGNYQSHPQWGMLLNQLWVL